MVEKRPTHEWFEKVVEARNATVTAACNGDAAASAMGLILACACAMLASIPDRGALSVVYGMNQTAEAARKALERVREGSAVPN